MRKGDDGFQYSYSNNVCIEYGNSNCSIFLKSRDQKGKTNTKTRRFFTR